MQLLDRRHDQPVRRQPRHLGLQHRLARLAAPAPVGPFVLEALDELCAGALAGLRGQSGAAGGEGGSQLGVVGPAEEGEDFASADRDGVFVDAVLFRFMPLV